MTGTTGRKTAGLLFFILVFVGVGYSSGEERAVSNRLKQTEALFNNFNRDTLHLADGFYDPDVVFQDPIVKLKGRDALKAYYADMYENVSSIRFDFSGGIEREKRQWSSGRWKSGPRG